MHAMHENIYIIMLLKIEIAIEVNLLILNMVLTIVEYKDLQTQVESALCEVSYHC